MTHITPPQHTPADLPHWQNELDFLINSIKTVPTVSAAFAIKLKLEGYLECAFHAKLIDSVQMIDYTRQINQTLTTRLY